MHPPRSLYAALLISLTFIPNAQSQQKPDAATAAWWAQTTALSNDSMEGRDTGTEAYDRAAKYVADQFQSAGLKPAGDNGTFFQRVPMHQVELIAEKSSIEILPDDGKPIPLQLLQQITVTPRDQMPEALTAPMVFIGDGANDLDVRDKIVVFFNYISSSIQGRPRDTFAPRRQQALIKAGAAAVISIDNPSAIEPFHWPASYARTVSLERPPVVEDIPSPPVPLSLRISADAASALFTNSGHSFSEILTLAGKDKTLPSFPLNASLRLRLTKEIKEISSPNILAILPGFDPKLAPEYVALSAHLDGYGYGTPVLGDNLYNGTLDDAAYVALLIELAKNLSHDGRFSYQKQLKHELKADPCAGRWQGEKPEPCSTTASAPTLDKAPARSLLFCIFTGEEKGLLGSAYFTQHLTVPKENIVANLNLDQLRPIFPLNILTMEGLNDSTLGETVQTVASQFKIEIRPDLEPERNLFRRADNYNFVRIGVPIASFIFGYDKDSPEELIYRDWYARRYHKPQDDIKTPIDWDAAAKFNRFYTALTLTIANASARPQWLPSSPYSPHPPNSLHQNPAQ
ncbi:MAG TPA: M28 family peptidase [Edaphobacter sp.]|nr:M28 family peptidase [Edaphobacter sp.]